MPRLRWSLPSLAAAALSAAGCASGPSSLDLLNATPPQEYRGHFTLGTDGSWFRPCGAAASDAAWWVTVTDAAVGQVARAREAGQLVSGQPSFVHWRAVRTTGGEVGPPGATALLVREVVIVRPAAANDCGGS